MRKPRKNYTPVDPTGTPLGDALCRDEGILYAKIDLARSVEPKQFHDVVGSYNRFDIFALTVNRSARRPATFVDERQDSAGSKIPPDRGPAGPEWNGINGFICSLMVDLGEEVEMSGVLPPRTSPRTAPS